MGIGKKTNALDPIELHGSAPPKVRKSMLVNHTNKTDFVKNL